METNPAVDPPVDAAELSSRWQQQAELRRLPAGELISEEGEPGDELFIIRSGSVAITKKAPEGEPILLGYRGPGELLGEIALITNSVRTATLRAAKPCELLVIRKADFRGLLRSDEVFRQMVMESLIGHLLTADRSRVAAEVFERDLAERFDELSSEHDRMADLMRMRQETTRFIIHDLRNPLHLAMAALAMVEEEPDYRPQSDLARFLTMAQGGLRRMVNLVDALLDIGRMETGQTLRRAAMDVRDLVERCVKGSQPLALIGNLTLRSAFPDGHGMPSICADATRMERVIMNLIDNAVRHTPADGEVVVSAWWDARAVWVAVDDTGPGIPASQRERIFDRFVQAEGEARSQGFGLGLAYCRSAVEAHGGSIRAEDSPRGQGARLVFSVPIQPPAV